VPDAAAASIVAPAKGTVGFGDQGDLPRVGKVLYDSRVGRPLAARETRVLDVLGSAGPVPAGANAVVLTVTAVDMRSSGWLTVWDGSSSRPSASTLNFTPGPPVPNTAVVTLAASRTLRVENGSSGTTHVLLSFQGFVKGDGAEVRRGSLQPTRGTRLLDTRRTSTPIPAKGYRDLKVTGSAVPAGAAAAVLDVVAVKPSRSGYLVAHAAGTARPGTTTLTYRVGADLATLAVVPISGAGAVRVWNMSTAPVHLVVDSFGWVAAGQGAAALAGLDIGAPARVLDTRTTGDGPVDGTQPRLLPRGSVPSSGTMFSVTVTAGTRAGYLRYGVPSSSLWSPSFLNFAPGQTVTGTVFIPTPPDPGLDVALQAVTTGTVHVIVDRLAVVAPRAAVQGSVRDAESGAVIARALAAVDGPDRYEPVAADGTFSRVPTSPESVLVCAATGTWTGRMLESDGRYVADCVGGDEQTAPRVSLPLGARLVDSDISLQPAGALTGTVLGPEGLPNVYGGITIERVDERQPNVYVSFGAGSGRTDGTWRVAVPAGTYIVSTSWGMRDGTVNGYLANEVATGLPRIFYAKEPLGTRDELVAAGAKTFKVGLTGTVAVPTLRLQDPGRIDPTIVDPDGDLSDVRIDYVHKPSGFRVWGYPVGSSESTLGASIPLRPGPYTVCVTEGTVTVCNDGASSPGSASPIEVSSGVTSETTLTLP